MIFASFLRSDFDSCRSVSYNGDITNFEKRDSMNQLGLIGGVGPESTIDYYRALINGWRKRNNTEDFPSIMINSINMTRMLSYVAQKDWVALTDLLIDEICKLEQAGADLPPSLPTRHTSFLSRSLAVFRYRL